MLHLRGSPLSRAAYVLDTSLIAIERHAPLLDKLIFWIGILLAFAGVAIVHLDASHPDQPFADHPALGVLNRFCIEQTRVSLSDDLTVLGVALSLIGAILMILKRVNRLGSTKS